MQKKIATDLLIGNKISVKGYHVQEYRSTVLENPVICCDKDAWLGFGFYFWLEVLFAHYWGEDKKSVGQSGSYDIYVADLNIENCLNTVFNEEHYLFLIEMIEESIKYLKSKEKTLSLEQVNRYLAEKMWPQHGIEGIIYDDKPTNPRNKNRVYSEIPNLYYKKRIQIVIFNMKNVSNFKLYLEDKTNLKNNYYA